MYIHVNWKDQMDKFYLAFLEIHLGTLNHFKNSNGIWGKNSYPLQISDRADYLTKVPQQSSSCT